MKPRTRRRTWLFRVAAVLLGLSVFAIAELVCVLADWGRPTRFDDPFVGFSAVHPLFELDETGDVYRTPESRHNFFAAEWFPAAKGPRTFRIFCLGGSTVQGRPWSTPTSFATWLELGLAAGDPRHDWEVINAGGISYASYRLVPILEECLRYEPDLFIVCTGHNEFLEDRTYRHIKHAPAVVAGPQRLAARLRTFTLLRQWAMSVAGTSDERADLRPSLSAETDPILDYHDSLAAYHRDEAWQAGVVAHCEYNLRRMADLGREAGVPLVFVLPPSNLGDTPPLKSEHRGDLSPEELSRWQRLVHDAQGGLRDDVQESLRQLREALAIDDAYAATWYELGKCHQAFGLHAEAREAFVTARDRDVCPLRMITLLEEALRQVCDDHRVPLLDAHALLEARCPHGILDGSLLVDHVHPSIEGHQLIADALLETLAAEGWADPRAEWRQKAHGAYRSHYATLDDFYFLRGQRTLDALQAWTQGQADGPSAKERFPRLLERTSE